MNNNKSCSRRTRPRSQHEPRGLVKPASSTMPDPRAAVVGLMVRPPPSPLLGGAARARSLCASAAERNWSVYGRVKHAGRVRMRHGVGDKLVYMHEALVLRLKLQKASYCQVAEKWDTDSVSDSDESDDEKNLKM